MRNVMLVCAAGLALAGCGQTEPAKPSPTGRFTIVHSPHLERDTQLLDTWTGQTWVLTETKEGGLSWESMGPPKNANPFNP